MILSVPLCLNGIIIITMHTDMHNIDIYYPLNNSSTVGKGGSYLKNIILYHHRTLLKY